jgi:hypothetical protein
LKFLTRIDVRYASVIRDLKYSKFDALLLRQSADSAGKAVGTSFAENSFGGQAA